MKDDKSTLVAVLLNLFLPGAGYMYLGRVFLGCIVFCVSIPLIFFTAGLAWIPLALIMTIDMSLLKSKREKNLLKQMKQCPQCAELVQKAAHVCRFCSHKFSSDQVDAA